MAEDIGFRTERNVELAKYKAQGKDFRARTRPYKSTLQIGAVVPSTENWPSGGTATMGHAVFRAKQTLEFFGYGLGDPIDWAQGSRKALPDDTNLAKKRNTNGSETFVIEGMSASCRSLRGEYPEGTYSGTDADVVAAYEGARVVYDPASLAFPPQLMSPFNLESTIMSLLQPLMSVSFVWDETDEIPIGTLDQIPEGGAKSYLRASGEPRNDNRLRVPEGYVWNRQSEPGGDFVIRVTLQEAAVMPISFVGIMASGDATDGNVLTNLYADIEMRVHGLGLSYPSGN